MKLLENEEGIAGTQQEVNLKKYIFKLLNRWPIILGVFLISVLIGYTLNRYATAVYLVKAKITTKKFSNKSTSPIPGLVDANFFLSGLTEVYEEIPTLKSPKRIEAAIDLVDFRISYFAKGLIKTTTESLEGYGFDVKIDSIAAGAYPFGIPIFVNHLSESTFELDIEDERWEKKVNGKKFSFGKSFNVGAATLQLINTNGKTAERDKYFFVLNRKADLVNEYSRKLDISWTMRGSSMLDLRIQSKSPEKDLQFLKAYYQVVEQIGLEEKNETLDNTIKFIDDQMAIVSDSLVYYQELIDQLKLSNRQLSLGAENIYSQLNEIDKKKADVILNERYFDYLTQYFKTKSTSDIFAPSLMGLNIPLVEGWVNQFINQKLKEKYARTTGNSLNPLVNREDSLKRKLEKGIFEAINSVRETNAQKVRELNNEANLLFSSVKGVQTDFRELSKYERMYQLNQTLFDLFLRRKTEAAISKASATSDYKVIDAPSYSRTPIRPDENMNLIIAAVLGLFLPIGFFLTKDLTNNRIMDKDDLQNSMQMPILGNVAHSAYPTNLVVKDHPRSVVAESFRSIRANLKYLASKVQTKSLTFLITSSVGGEGKTFCSLNLASTLAASQKKTVLIAADLRKPQLANYLDRDRSLKGKGLSDYLVGLATIEEVLVGPEEGLPYLIDAGSIPPNPSELLSSEKMVELVAYLKEHFEYIIIDTPPIGLVSDALELFKYSDYNILIVRQKVTHKAALRMINELYLEGKLRNFTVLFNDIELNRKGGAYYGGYLYGMGYSGYGYGYYQEDQQDNRLFRRKKSRS
jgi:capsular exopolysaccharide synthesis family protein